MVSDLLAELSRLYAAATPGDWRWRVNRESKSVALNGPRGTVMDFARYGMQSAQPRFQSDGLMYPASELTAVIPGREHHEKWCVTVDHPDAEIITALHNSFPALLAEIERLTTVASAARDAALEEAAALCDDRYPTRPEIAAAIRALKGRA